MVNPFANVAMPEDDGRTVAEMERISNRPWKVTVAPGVVDVEGCRSETLETVPEPVKTQRPMLRFRQYRVTASMISVPPGSSRTYGDIDGSGSRVMTMGGLGLFLDPGGRPLGRLTTSIDAPSLAPVVVVVVMSFLIAWPVGLRLRLSASSEVLLSWNWWLVMAKCCDGGGGGCVCCCCWWWWL